MTWSRVTLQRRASAPILSAPLADPLWLVGCQSRLGELAGEDASAPTVGRVTLEHGAVEARGDVPCEVAQRVPRWPSWGQAAASLRAGALLLRLFRGAGGSAEGATTLRRAWPCSALPQEARDRLTEDEDLLLKRLSATALNGRRVYGTSEATLQGVLAKLSDDDQAAFRAIHPAWRATVEPDLASSSPASWEASALTAPWPEARLCAGDGGGTLARASNGAEGWAAWTLGRATEAQPELHEQELVAAELRWKGQPSRRWWEIEAEGADLEALQTDDAPLRQLFLSFALGGADDWFTLAVPAPTGGFCRVRRLEVQDAFGQRAVVESAAARDIRRWKKRPWRFLELDSAEEPQLGGPGPWVPAPASLEPPRRGPVVERALLSGDPGQGPAWARELLVQGARGAGLEREAALAHHSTTTLAEDTWDLLGDPPPDRVPFVAGESPDTLRRARLPGWPTTGPRLLRGGPAGRLLGSGGLSKPSASGWPAEGAALSLRRRTARSADGVLGMFGGDAPRQEDRSGGLGFCIDIQILTRVRTSLLTRSSIIHCIHVASYGKWPSQAVSRYALTISALHAKFMMCSYTPPPQATQRFTGCRPLPHLSWSSLTTIST